jgi:hypothetical protein
MPKSNQSSGTAYRGNWATPEDVPDQPLRTPERIPERGNEGPEPENRDNQPDSPWERG